MTVIVCEMWNKISFQETLYNPDSCKIRDKKGCDVIFEYIYLLGNIRSRP